MQTVGTVTNTTVTNTTATNTTAKSTTATTTTVTTIADPADPRLDDFRDLRRPDARRTREGDEFLVAEGPNVVRRLCSSGLRMRAVLIAESKRAGLDDVVESTDAPVYVVSRQVLAEVAGFDLHRGVIASADRPPDVEIDTVVQRAIEASGTVAILQGLNDHENLGAIARSARAFGVQAIVLDATCADPWYRRTVRVSMGEILHLSIARSEDLGRDIDRMRAAGVNVAALTPNETTSGGPSVDIHRWARPDGAVALVLGAEGPGLPDSTLHACDVRLRIPIAADVDSLNVGHAAAVAFALVARPC